MIHMTVLIAIFSARYCIMVFVSELSMVLRVHSHGWMARLS